MATFSLKEARNNQIQNVVNNSFNYWSENSTYGYFGGGYIPGGITFSSTILRLDYNNDLISLLTNNFATLGKSGTGSFSNSLHGYFGGGYNAAAAYTAIERLDISTEIVSNLSSKLSIARGDVSCVVNDQYGYFGGGFNGTIAPPATYSTLDRFDFASENVSTPITKYPTNFSASFQASTNSYGYFGGGYVPLGIGFSNIRRLDFSTESFSTITSTLTIGRESGSSIQTNSYGYFCSGLGNATPNRISTIDRFDFSNETINNSITPLPLVQLKSGYNSNNINGYTIGGQDSSSQFTSSTYRFNFSTETSITTTNLPSARYQSKGFSGGASVLRNNKTYGYFVGGTPSQLSTRINFSNETINTLINDLPASTYALSSTSSNYYGYFGGGFVSGTGIVNTISRLDFSNETFSNPGNNLLSIRRNLVATSSNSYGYFGGGYTTPPPATLNTISRLDFSNETFSNPGKNLLSNREYLSGTSNSSYGYFGGGGGSPTGIINTISRLDFSNETVSDPGKNLPSERYGVAATSSNSYGYFGGGYLFTTFLNTIIRIDFSNETISNTTNLPSGRRLGSATSSSLYSYFVGGYNPSNTTGTSTINRLNLSTETISNTTNLFSTKYLLEAISNSN